MTAIIVFCILSFLLVSGKILRTLIPLFQKLYLPSSVIGGLLGLIIFSVLGDKLPAEWCNAIKKIPGFMINVIFASLFLGAVTPKLKTVFKTAFPQICMGQLLAWGQYAIGIGLTGLVFIPFFGINQTFGNLLEIGFQGGHGTVGGLTPYLSEKEIQLLRKSMKSIRNRVDVEEDVSVLESLRKYGEAINLWPEKQLPDTGYTKGYFAMRGFFDIAQTQSVLRIFIFSAVGTLRNRLFSKGSADSNHHRQ